MAKYQYKVKGVDYDVEINEIEGNIANVTVNGIPFEVEMKQPIKSGVKTKVVQQQTEPHPTEKVSEVKEQTVQQSQNITGTPVTAPLPGTINDIKVSVGDQVNAGDTVVILEAMKMQNNIEAEKNGIIKAIKVNKGDNVMEGDVLVIIG
nr:biotin/lipoyl-binding protein [Prevotella sp.]